MLDLRKELARQKYVNQVLWRKLDALIDIHGSNTRAELAIELANYHEELEALKAARQHRAHANLSRSSSGVCQLLSLIYAYACFFFFHLHKTLFFSPSSSSLSM